MTPHIHSFHRRTGRISATPHASSGETQHQARREARTKPDERKRNGNEANPPTPPTDPKPPADPTPPTPPSAADPTPPAKSEEAPKGNPDEVMKMQRLEAERKAEKERANALQKKLDEAKTVEEVQKAIDDAKATGITPASTGSSRPMKLDVKVNLHPAIGKSIELPKRRL